MSHRYAYLDIRLSVERDMRTGSALSFGALTILILACGDPAGTGARNAAIVVDSVATLAAMAYQETPAPLPLPVTTTSGGVAVAVAGIQYGSNVAGMTGWLTAT